MTVFSTLRTATLLASTIVSVAQIAQAIPLASSALENDTVDYNSVLLKRSQFIDIPGLQGGVAGSHVPVRQDFRVLAQDPTMLNLYLLALERFQQAPQESMTSWYQIAGIHGRPYLAWDTVGGGNNDGGYCTHADILFPSWHRPYLAVYEQSIFNHVQDIAAEFPAGSKYQAAAPNFRIPYWDWASDISIPALIGSTTQVQVEKPTGTVTIKNPLYSYNFHPLDPSQLPDEPFNAMNQTYRNPTQTNGQWKSDIVGLNKQLNRIGANMRSRVYTLFTAYTDYLSFSNKATTSAVNGKYDSLEGVHDTIHGTIGGDGGHMGIVDYAAFDPIFFLHHTNIDRLFAIWQVINPKTYITPQVNEYGTYAIPAGSTEDETTPLWPFHKSDTEYYTSDSARNVTDFGYTYPELANAGSSPATFRANVISAVNKLYGRSAASGLLRSASTANAKRQTTPSASSIEAHTDKLVQGNTYNEYLADIRVDNSALNGTFFIHVFIGQPSSDPSNWSLDANLVGTHSVFTTIGGGHSRLVSGSIPLTNTLINRVVVGELNGLQIANVVPYLKENLHWRVQSLDQTVVYEGSVDELRIQVASAEVTLPETDEELPVWGEMQPQYEVTAGRAGGLNSGEQL